MSGIVRLSYRDPKTNTKKFLQTKISIHGSKEVAKKFLETRRDVILGQLDKDTEDGESNGDKKLDEPDIESPEINIPDQKLQDGCTDEDGCTNLMDLQIETSPELDRIYAELRFSPFKLDMDVTQSGHSLCILGSSKSGKSYLLKYLLEKYVSGKGISVLAAQSVHNPIYADYPSDVIKTDAYSNKIVKSAVRINKKLQNKYAFTFILDDIIDKKNDKYLEEMYLTLRNSKISVITLLQSTQLLKSTSRSNSNILILKKFNNPKAIRDYIMEEFIGNYPPFKSLSMKDKVSLYIKITNDGHYNFFVLDVLNNTLILCRGTDL